MNSDNKPERDELRSYLGGNKAVNCVLKRCMTQFWMNKFSHVTE